MRGQLPPYPPPYPPPLQHHKVVCLPKRNMDDVMGLSVLLLLRMAYEGYTLN